MFRSPADRRALEAIVHPPVRAEIEAWFEEVATDSRVPFAVAAIPLLFETGQQTRYNQIVVTTCAREIQLARLRSRGLTDADAERRIAAQLPDAVRLAGADFVIRTGGMFTETDNQVDAACKALRGQAPA